MQNHRYQELLGDFNEARRQSLALVAGFAVKRNWQFATLNLAFASSNMVSAAHTEWRLGTGDPSHFLRDAIGDARELTKYFDNVIGINDRSANMMAIWDAIYSQLLLGAPIDAQFRRCCQIPPQEKRCPGYFKEYWIHPWDALVLELVETGKTPGEWEEFVGWLENKRGGRNLLKTMLAYKQLIGSAKANDSATAAKAIAAAEKCFKARRNMTLTWGGGDLSEQTVDHRLACAIKKAEEISPGITTGVDTPHRWRW